MAITRIRSGLILVGALVALSWPAVAIWRDVLLRHDIANAEALLQRQAKTPEEASEIASVVFHLPVYRARYAARWSATGDATLAVAGTLFGVLVVVAGLRRRPG